MPQETITTRAQLPQLASVADIAEAFDVCEVTVWRWVEQGKLPAPDVRQSKRTLRWSPAAYSSFLTFGTRQNAS